LFILSQLLLIGDGLLARDYWLSFQARPSRMGPIVRGLALAHNAQALGAVAVLGYLWAPLAIGVLLAGVAVANLLAGSAAAPPAKAAA